MASLLVKSSVKSIFNSKKFSFVIASQLLKYGLHCIQRQCLGIG